MPKLPVLKGKELVHILKLLGFTITGRKGSHVRMRAADGRAVTVPVHAGKDLPKGLLRKIIREDLSMRMEDFAAHCRKKN